MKRKFEETISDVAKKFKPGSSHIVLPDQDDEFLYSYAGCIFRNEPRHGWTVNVSSRIDGKNVQRSKSFNDKKYGGKETARLAAEQYRKELSNSRGLTVRRKRLETISHEIKAFISGFFCGDGTVTMVKTESWSKNPFKITVMFAQSSSQGEPELLKMVQRNYGGNINKAGQMTRNSRPAYALMIRSRSEVIGILTHMKEFCTIKLPQITLVLDYIVNVDSFSITQRQEIADKLHAAKHLSAYRAVQIDAQRLIYPYLAGLFAAEGCVGLYMKKHTGGYVKICAIAQKSSPSLLKAINLRFNGAGFIKRTENEDQAVVFSTKSAILSFINSILPYLHGPKVAQCLMMKEFCQMQPTTHKYSESQANQIAEWIERIKKMKKT